jgi:hypothetical protein
VITYQTIRRHRTRDLTHKILANCPSGLGFSKKLAGAAVVAVSTAIGGSGAVA